MTPEQALIAAQNSEQEEFTWKHWRVPGALAHQFAVEHGWMRSRCGEAIWTVTWWPAPDDAPRCPDCSAISDNSIETQVRAILRVAARTAVPA